MHSCKVINKHYSILVCHIPGNIGFNRGNSTKYSIPNRHKLIPPNTRYGTANQHDMRLELSDASRNRKRTDLHNPLNNDFGDNGSGLLNDQSSGGDIIEQRHSRRVPKMPYSGHLDESELQPRRKDQIIDACWNLKIKMQKQKKDRSLSGFNNIFDKAVKESELDKLREMGRGVRKNAFLLMIAQLTMKVEGRAIEKEQAVRRIIWAADLKRNMALKGMRHVARGGKLDLKRNLVDETSQNKCTPGLPIILSYLAMIFNLRYI